VAGKKAVNACKGSANDCTGFVLSSGFLLRNRNPDFQVIFYPIRVKRQI